MRVEVTQEHMDDLSPVTAAIEDALRGQGIEAVVHVRRGWVAINGRGFDLPPEARAAQHALDAGLKLHPFTFTLHCETAVRPSKREA